MKRVYLLFLFLFVNIYFTEAQIQRCGTAELHRHRMETEAEYRAYYEHIAERMEACQHMNIAERATGGVITIPVVVHVLYNISQQDIPDPQIHSQIDILNKDFTASNTDIAQVPPAFQSVIGNAHLNFCLATITPTGDYTTGIERRYTATTSYSVGDQSVKMSSMGGLDAWDRSKYLNLWVCNLTGRLLGYTEMLPCPPELDGCVILYTAFGSTGNQYANYHNYNLGRTATHEIGHWLGLFHVWGDDGGTCTGTDHINDTPNQADNTFGCPAYPKTDACSPSAPGVMYMNYLDYTDDRCMHMFSAGQVAVMTMILDSARSSILNSKGCVAPAGLADINAETFIELYPNPADNDIIIDFHLPLMLLNVMTYDMVGKEVLASTVNKTGEQKINLNASLLSSGQYILILKTEQGNIAKRFAVSHLK